jgi:hypothetical protein
MNIKVWAVILCGLAFLANVLSTIIFIKSKRRKPEPELPPAFEKEQDELTVEDIDQMISYLTSYRERKLK